MLGERIVGWPEVVNWERVCHTEGPGFLGPSLLLESSILKVMTAL